MLRRIRIRSAVSATRRALVSNAIQILVETTVAGYDLRRMERQPITSPAQPFGQAGLDDSWAGQIWLGQLIRPFVHQLSSSFIARMALAGRACNWLLLELPHTLIHFGVHVGLEFQRRETCQDHGPCVVVRYPRIILMATRRCALVHECLDLSRDFCDPAYRVIEGTTSANRR